MGQFVAVEGQAFMLVAAQVLTENNLEKNLLVGDPVTKTVSDCVFLFKFAPTCSGLPVMYGGIMLPLLPCLTD